MNVQRSNLRGDIRLGTYQTTPAQEWDRWIGAPDPQEWLDSSGAVTFAECIGAFLVFAVELAEKEEFRELAELHGIPSTMLAGFIAGALTTYAEGWGAMPADEVHS